MQRLIATLEALTPLPPSLIAFLPEIVFSANHPKGTLLAEQGEPCRHIYFIEKGLLRGCYQHGSKDITTWFAREQDMVTSMSAFLTGQPAIENIEVLEDASVKGISYDHLQLLYQRFPEFNIVGRLLSEKYYIELETRTLSLQYHSARERYLKLLNEQPYILQKVALGQVASYLGMSQETLSRIRKNL